MGLTAGTVTSIRAGLATTSGLDAIAASIAILQAQQENAVVSWSGNTGTWKIYPDENHTPGTELATYTILRDPTTKAPYSITKVP